MIYSINGEVDQHICMKINEDFAFPEKIKLTRAVLYTFQPKPRKQVWKDGTGKVQKTWTFTPWLRVYDEDGDCGEGPVTPAVWQTILPLMLKDPMPRTNLEWRKIFYWMERANYNFSVPMFQMEVILFDLISRKRGIPMYQLLGAEKNYADIYKGGGSVLRTDEELVEEILTIKEEGFDTTKIKISLGDMKNDLRRIEKIRLAVGPDMKLAVDSNQAYDAQTAMKFIREAYQYDIAWYEEPIVHTESEEIAKFIRMMKEEDRYVPVDYGESARYALEYKAYMDAGVEYITVMPSIYTMGEFLKITDMVRSRGCHVCSGQNDHPGALMGVMLKDGEKVEFHKPNTEYMEQYYRLKPTRKGTRLYLPDEPGLPVQINFEKLEKDGCVSNIQYFYR